MKKARVESGVRWTWTRDARRLALMVASSMIAVAATAPAARARTATTPQRRTVRTARRARPERVSVVIPAYRAAATIGRALDSVLGQTRAPDQIIVVDDGSPDDTAAVVAAYGDAVTLVRQPNGGAASARNTGIAHATGDVVTFLDADDYWEPHKLERQLAVFDRHPEVGVVGSWLFLEEPDAATRRTDPAIDGRLFDRVLELDGADAFHAAGMFWTGTVAVRRELLAGAGFDESLATAEDRELWLRLLLQAPAYLSGEPLATCVLVPGSLSRGDVGRDCENMLAVVDRYRELLGPEVHRRWRADVHRRWSTRLLAEGDPRGALRPALEHLRLAPSLRALVTVARSAVESTAAYLPRATPRALSAPAAPVVGAGAVAQVGVVDDLAGFVALRETWDELHGRSGAPTLALTWDWLFTWWETFAEGRRLQLLTVRDGDGRLIGVAPLCARTARFHGVPLRRLELLATGEDEADEILSEYLDFVIERGREAEVHDAIWAHLATRDDWDELCLASIPAASPLVAGLRVAVTRSGAPVDVTTAPRPDGILVTLAPDATRFVAAQSKRMREDLRRHRRMLERHGPVRLRRAESLDDLRAMFPELVRLHQALWRSRGKPGCFASDRFTRFHQRVSERMLARGMLDLHVLTVGERAVAARYGFQLGTRLFEYQSGSDPDFDPKVSIGVQAAQLCMEAAIARGAVDYDLGEGPRPYKLRWGHVRQPTLNVWLTRRSPRTLVRALAAAGERQARELRRAYRSRAGGDVSSTTTGEGGGGDDA